MITKEELLAQIAAEEAKQARVKTIPVPRAVEKEALLAEIAEAEKVGSENPYMRQLKLLGGGAVRGATGLVGDIASGAETIMDMTNAPRAPGAPSLKESVKAANVTLGSALPPRALKSEPGGQITEAVGESLGATAVLPVGRPATLLRDAVGAGIGTELGGNVNEKYGPIIGALLGGTGSGLVTSAAGNVKNNIRDVADALVGSETDARLKAARDVFDRAQRGGIPMRLDQALPSPESSYAASFLNESSVGRGTRGTTDAQGNAIVEGMNRRIEGLGGVRQTPAQAEKGAQQAATDDFNRFSRRLGQAFQRRSRDEQKTTVIAPDELKVLQRHFLKEAQNNPAIRPDMEAFVSSLNNQDIKTVQQLKDVLDTAVEGVAKRDPLSGGSANKNIAQIERIVSETQDSLFGKYTPNFQSARERFAGQARVRDALKGSPAGRVAGGGAELDEEGSSALFQIFKKGSDPKLANPRRSEIRFVGERINKVNPAAFRDGYTSFLSKEIADTTKRTGDTVTPETVAQLNFRLFGTDSKRQGMRDSLYVIGKGKGLSEADSARLATGFENFMYVVNRASKQVKGSGEAGKELAQTAGKSSAATGFRFPYLGNLANWTENFYTRGTFKELDRLFNSKEGLDKLVELSRQKKDSPVTDALVRSFIVAGEQSNNSPAQE